MKKFSEWIEPIREAQINEASELQKSYQEYFKAKLAKYDAESPADLDEEEKKKFFNEISADWERGKGVKPEAKEKLDKEKKEAEVKAEEKKKEEEKKESERPSQKVTDMEGSADDKLKSLTKTK